METETILHSTSNVQVDVGNDILLITMICLDNIYVKINDMIVNVSKSISFMFLIVFDEMDNTMGKTYDLNAICSCFVYRKCEINDYVNRSF